MIIVIFWLCCCDCSKHSTYICEHFLIFFQPFWPMGTGCARGFLAAFDTVWMTKQWASCNSIGENLWFAFRNIILKNICHNRYIHTFISLVIFIFCIVDKLHCVILTLIELNLILIFCCYAIFQWERSCFEYLNISLNQICLHNAHV